MTEDTGFVQMPIRTLYVEPGADMDVHCQPPMPVRLRRIEHTGSIDGLSITSLRVGLHEQVVWSPGPVPFKLMVAAINRGEAFLEPLSPERPLNMTLRNRSSERRALLLVLHFEPVGQ